MKIRHDLRKSKWVVVSILLLLFLTCLLLFHGVRGERIVAVSDDVYKQAVARLHRGPVTVHSTQDMMDLGAVASRAVSEEGLSPGSFYVLFLPRLDVREMLHHFVHSPVTGFDSIYADIWFNSCTVYGSEEPTWGIRRSRVYPADKLSVLLILLDRLKRGKTPLQEHLGAYLDVFPGMELHSLPGRARCWTILMKQCTRDDKLAAFVGWQLKMRRTEGLDAAERDFWNYLLERPSRNTVEALAASKIFPAAFVCGKSGEVAPLFEKLIYEYRFFNHKTPAG